MKALIYLLNILVFWESHQLLINNTNHYSFNTATKELTKELLRKK